MPIDAERTAASIAGQTTRRFRVAFIAADGVGLRIEGSGPAVVLLHSSMSSKSQWRELIESLRDRYRLIAIDLLGYGESPMPGDGYSLADEVSLVESVLARELRPHEQFHLIGHSYGGVVALQLAAQSQSQRLRSLTCSSPSPFIYCRLVIPIWWQWMRSGSKSPPV